MVEASPDEKIPVAIWYEDIDQEQVDTLTTQKVGFSQEEVALDYEMPSTSLLNDLKAEKNGANAELEAYMERTKLQRESERKRTDEYIMTRREFSRAEYNEMSAKIIKDLSLKKADITFKSQYAPLIEIYADVNTIYKLANSNKVLSLNYNRIENEITYANDEQLNRTTNDSNVEIMKEVIGYNDVVTKFGLTGQGVNIGIYEIGGNILDNDTVVPREQFITVGAVTSNYHVGNTASVLIGTDIGLAPNAMVYSTNTTAQYVEAMLTTYNVKLLNASFYDCLNDEKWCNHLVAYHNVTLIASTGNISQSGIFVHSPASYSNSIGIGAYTVSETYDISDDIMYNSSYEEKNNGISKPDVVMPLDIALGGTSSATPVLTASVALLYELKPSLAMQPQAVKAIVLASCDRKVKVNVDDTIIETMQDGLTEYQGAGAPNLWNMVCIVSNGTYGIGTINPHKTQGIRRFILPSYGNSYANLSIAWLTENSHGDDYSSITSANNPNLNLSIYNGIDNQQLLDSSNNVNSSTEMVYFELGNDFNYEFRITKATTSNIPIRYGYAYSLIEPELYSESGDEICYIRNYNYDQYLTLNPTTGETSLQPFDGSDEQKWVVKKTGSNSYKLIAGYNKDSLITSELTLGNTISNGLYKASTKNSVTGDDATDMEFQILSNEMGIDMFDGSVAFFYPDPERLSNNYILTCSNGSGAFVKCSMNEPINGYRSWVLEKANYKQWDTDLNGNINVKDATAIQKHLSGTYLINNIGYTLADADYNGVVNVLDATYIQKNLTN